MEFQYTKNETNQEFILTGKLDQESYTEFDKFVHSEYSKGLNVILNVVQLEYISSVGLRSFIALAKLVRADKKDINLKAREGSMVKKLITLSGFTKLMPFVID